MPDHQHPENATIREVQAVEKALLDAMREMEKRLVAKIDSGFAAHDAEHEALVRRANERHAAIDAILREEEMDEIRHAGQMEVATLPIRLLEYANHYKWLIGMLLAFIGWLLKGDASITIGG